MISDLSVLSSSTITPDMTKKIPNAIAKNPIRFDELLFFAIVYTSYVNNFLF